MSVAQWVRRIRGTADLRVNHSANTTEVALDDSGFLKYGQGGTTRTVVDAGQSQTITGNKTLSGTTVLSGATTLSGTTTLSGAVAFTGTSTKTVVQQATAARVGTTAGWVIPGNNKGSMATQAAGTTSATLVIIVPGLRVGDVITGYYFVGQIESGGNTCTLDAALRKHVAAAADNTDGAVTNGAIAQVSATADTLLSAANAGVTGLSVTVAADETYYVLVTSTTAASTDIDLMSLNVTKTAA